MDYIYNICLPVVRAGVEVVGGEVVLVTGAEIYVCKLKKDFTNKSNIIHLEKFILF